MVTVLINLNFEFIFKIDIENFLNDSQDLPFITLKTFIKHLLKYKNIYKQDQNCVC